MEAEKDAERQGDALDQRPRKVAEELRLDRAVLHLVHFEGVDDPHGQVADQQECHHLNELKKLFLFSALLRLMERSGWPRNPACTCLSPRLLSILTGGVDPPPLGVGDEEKLQEDLIQWEIFIIFKDIGLGACLLGCLNPNAINFCPDGLPA